MNYNTQNEKIKAITENHLVVGIDIGSDKHYARYFDYRGIELSKKPFSFENSEEGFNSFLEESERIAKDNRKSLFVIGMEPTGHYWFNLGDFVEKQEQMTLVHVNPCHVRRTKELDDNSPSKNDRKDPKVIAGLVRDGRYFYPYIPDGVYADVRNYSNLRTKASKNLTRTKNQIARWVSIHYPEISDVYHEPYAVSLFAILKTAPLPEDIKALGAEKIEAIWREKKIRGVGMKRAQELVETAKRSIGRTKGSDSARAEICQLLEDYETYDKREKEMTKKLEEETAKVSYIENILNISGLGIKTVSGILAETGDLHRFKSPKQIQKLAGLEIVSTNSSGKHEGETRISYRGRKRLRYYLFEAALCLIRVNPEFREIYTYYLTRKENPLKKMQALIAVSCKLIRVIFAIATKNVIYDGQKMLSDIRRTTIKGNPEPGQQLLQHGEMSLA